MKAMVVHLYLRDQRAQQEIVPLASFSKEVSKVGGKLKLLEVISVPFALG